MPSIATGEKRASTATMTTRVDAAFSRCTFLAAGIRCCSGKSINENKQITGRVGPRRRTNDTVASHPRYYSDIVCNSAVQWIYIVRACRWFC